MVCAPSSSLLSSKSRRAAQGGPAAAEVGVQGGYRFAFVFFGFFVVFLSKAFVVGVVVSPWLPRGGEQVGLARSPSRWRRDGLVSDAELGFCKFRRRRRRRLLLLLILMGEKKGIYKYYMFPFPKLLSRRRRI